MLRFAATWSSCIVSSLHSHPRLTRAELHDEDGEDMMRTWRTGRELRVVAELEWT